MKLSDLTADYFASDFMGRASNTLRNHEQYVGVFVRFIGGRLTVQTYTDWVKAAFARWAPSTARVAVSSSARFLSWAERMGHIKDSPHRKVRLPEPEPTDPRVPFSADEYERLKTAAGPEMRWLIILGWETGMAIGDAALLEWSSVSLTEACIRIERQKTAEKCTIPLDPDAECHQTLLRWSQEPRQDVWPNVPALDRYYVSPTLAGRYLVQAKAGGADLQREFARVRARAGVDESKSFHNLRATMISQLANGGMQLAAACRVSGHKDPKIFLRYVSADVEGLREQMLRARQSFGS